jgi:hypothetical protein
MCSTTNDLALNEDHFDAFASRRTSCGMSSRTTTDNDQFLLYVHVVEVTGNVVVVVEVEVLVVGPGIVVEDEVVVVVVVVVPKVGRVVEGTLTTFGQYFDG